MTEIDFAEMAHPEVAAYIEDQLEGTRGAVRILSRERDRVAKDTALSVEAKDSILSRLDGQLYTLRTNLDIWEDDMRSAAEKAPDGVKLSIRVLPKPGMDVDRLIEKITERTRGIIKYPDEDSDVMNDTVGGITEGDYASTELPWTLDRLDALGDGALFTKDENHVYYLKLGGQWFAMERELHKNPAKRAGSSLRDPSTLLGSITSLGFELRFSGH